MKINNNKIKSLFLLSLVGSGAGKDKNLTNQSEIAYPNGINLNSLPKLVSNLTDKKFTDEDDPNQFDFLAGYPISIENQKNCTASYAFVVSDCQDAGKNGFITSSRCCVNCNGEDDISDQNGDLLGSSLYSSFVPYSSINHSSPSDFPLDYLYVNTNLSDIDIKLTPYVLGLNFSFYPITSSWSLTEPGFTVCAYGAKKGYFCGKLVDFNWDIIFFDPIDNSNGIFKGLNRVEMGENDVNFEPGVNLDNENLGAPVYLADSYENVGQTTARILGHITLIENTDWTTKHFWYTPIDTVLQDLSTKTNCEFNLIIDDSIDTKEFQTQIEIPPKK
jgi:hypothetical protein